MERIHVLPQGRPRSEEVEIPADSAGLGGHLDVPPGACGVVICAHSSGMGRRSPRSRFVAERLRQSRLATLAVDLLSPGEAERHAPHFNFDLLVLRLRAATAWAQGDPRIELLPLGYLAGGTGIAAALRLAAEMGSGLGALVSRGGRPDLAAPFLKQVIAPTLLLVGEKDEIAFELNRKAYETLGGQKALALVPGATHLFTEPASLETVARHAAAWFGRFLGSEESPGADPSLGGDEP